MLLNRGPTPNAGKRRRKTDLSYASGLSIRVMRFAPSTRNRTNPSKFFAFLRMLNPRSNRYPLCTSYSNLLKRGPGALARYSSLQPPSTILAVCILPPGSGLSRPSAGLQGASSLARVAHTFDRQGIDEEAEMTFA